MKTERKNPEHGGALLEFALVAVVLYLILTATIEFGRVLFSAQLLQDVSRLAARELAVMPMPIATTFEQALTDSTVKARIWDATKLVVDASGTEAQLDARFAALPLVNRALRPLMIYDDFSCAGHPLYRYPGRMVSGAPNPPGAEPYASCGLTGEVTVPVLNGGVCCVDLSVLAEVRSNAADPDSGPFSGVSAATPNGVVALQVRYPFQAATMSGYAIQSPGDPTIGAPLEADAATPVGTYSGTDGRGAQYAFGKKVLPYRRILTGQSYFRREVME